MDKCICIKNIDYFFENKSYYYTFRMDGEYKVYNVFFEFNGIKRIERFTEVFFKTFFSDLQEYREKIIDSFL